MSSLERPIVGAAFVVIVAGAKTERRTVVKITAKRKSDCLEIVWYVRERGCDDDAGFCGDVVVAGLVPDMAVVLVVAAVEAIEAAANL